MKDFAKSIVGNTKVVNGLKEDLLKKDSLARDVKASATYEAIRKQPWKVYDILGVGDSALREEAFELVSRKYGMSYDVLYKAWRDGKWPEDSKWANSKTGNSKVGNGSGSWRRGNLYEDGEGNSATVMKTGKGWEVVWEDARGYGKSVGVYKDESTAREVAEDVVETEMPDRIKSNYRSKAINTRSGNSKVENSITKFGVGTMVVAEGHVAKVLRETVEQGPNGIPFGWVRVKFIEGPWRGQEMEYYDYDLKKR